LTYIGGYWRGFLSGAPPEEEEPASALKDQDMPRRKWKRYPGLFVLLKQKGWVSPQQWQAMVGTALVAFRAIVFPPVPTYI